MCVLIRQLSATTRYPYWPYTYDEYSFSHCSSWLLEESRIHDPDAKAAMLGSIKNKNSLLRLCQTFQYLPCLTTPIVFSAPLNDWLSSLSNPKPYRKYQALGRTAQQFGHRLGCTIISHFICLMISWLGRGKEKGIYFYCD